MSTRYDKLSLGDISKLSGIAGMEMSGQASTEDVLEEAMRAMWGGLRGVPQTYTTYDLARTLVLHYVI
mgnify:FL=1